jgi:hypothetical protein
LAREIAFELVVDGAIIQSYTLLNLKTYGAVMMHGYSARGVVCSFLTEA